MTWLERKESLALPLIKILPRWLTAMQLTGLRIILVIPLIWLLLNQQTLPAAIIFIVAAVLDYLDGPLARYRNQVTTAGKLLDPLADKLIALPIVIILGAQFIPTWLIMLIVGLEILLVLMSSLLKMIFRSLGLDRPLGANIFGKIKFSLQVIACLLMFLLLPSYSINQFIIFWLWIIAVIFALASIIKHIAPSRD
ncbi:MAG: CDP-alcohol phosphatidyltransferase family protein [Candidatus Komeilibacteria bacterium]